MPLGERRERGNASTQWEVPSLVGTEGALWSLREECSNRYVEGKVEICIKGWCQPALPSLRHFSVCLLGQVGAGY